MSTRLQKIAQKALLLDNYAREDPAFVLVLKYLHASNPKQIDYSHKFNRKQKCYNQFLVSQAFYEVENVLKAFVYAEYLNVKIYDGIILSERYDFIAVCKKYN